MILREFKKEDTTAIEKMIEEAWHYHELCSSRTAHQLAKVFLISCLCNQTYTQVAISNGTPIGVIMAKDIKSHSCPIRYRLKQVISILTLFLSKEGRSVSKVFSSVSHIDQDLLRKSNISYQGELAFFVVSASTRGKGVGNALFHSALQYMESQHIKDFFLYTDTSCNYGFYEHQGMNRRCTQNTSFFLDGQRAEMTFYLYDHNIKKRQDFSYRFRNI